MQRRIMALIAGAVPLMFWRTSHPAGHVATYVGDGKVVTNVPGGAVEIVPWRDLNEWGPYVGWANPYYG